MENREQVIKHLIQHRRDLLTKREQLVQGIDAEIEHVNATIASLQGSSSDAAQDIVSALSEFPIAKIRNMTQVKALVTIAKHRDGIIEAQDAKRLLIRAGVMHQTKNSTSMIHTVIRRSDRFERISPGRYRLKEARRTSESEGNQLFRQLTQ